jgi:hypothetical protein
MRTRSGRTTRNEPDADIQVATPSWNGESQQHASVPVTSSAIRPPRVKDISHDALVEWKRERREYEDAIAARCAATGEDIKKALMPIKSTFDWHLLETLCRLDWDTTTDEVSEERIISELDAIVNNVKNGDVADIDALFDVQLRMDMRESDVKARVLRYFQLCDKIILQNGLKNIFDTPKGVKEKCKILVRHLQPAVLRSDIEHEHWFGTDNSIKTSEVALYKFVKDQALKQEKVFRSMSGRQQLQRQHHQPRPPQHQEK